MEIAAGAVFPILVSLKSRFVIKYFRALYREMTLDNEFRDINMFTLALTTQLEIKIFSFRC